MAILGVVTAWRHLHVLSNLWTTPYGWALIRKLIFVAVVVVLGAWNWKKQRPKLGGDDGLHSIRKSARLELIAATIVLVLTGVLVSIPSPKAPGEGAKPLPAANAPVQAPAAP
jgi:putative copper export protein